MGFNFVGCITQMFNDDFVTGGCGGTFFFLVPFHDIINFSAVFRYGISRQMEFSKDTLTLESADEIL